MDLPSGSADGDWEVELLDASKRGLVLMSSLGMLPHRE